MTLLFSSVWVSLSAIGALVSGGLAIMCFGHNVSWWERNDVVVL